MTTSMDVKELEKITKSISDKVGKETAGIIADDLGTLMTMNKTTNDEIAKLKQTNSELQTRNEQLIASNSNLLKQIPCQSDLGIIKEEKKDTTKFSYFDMFDEKGNFKN